MSKRKKRFFEAGAHDLQTREFLIETQQRAHHTFRVAGGDRGNLARLLNIDYAGDFPDMRAGDTGVAADLAACAAALNLRRGTFADDAALLFVECLWN